MDEMSERSGTGLMRRAGAIVLIALAAFLVLKLAVGAVIGLVTGLLSIVALVAIVVAVIWALRQL